MNPITDIKEYNYNGLLLGLFLSADMIIKIINVFIPAQNILVFYYLSIIMLGLFVNKFRFNIKYILLYLCIALLFCISVIRVTNNFYTLQYFVYFSCFYFACNILQFVLNINKTFKTINTINVIYALYLIFVIFKRYKQGILNINYTMDLSYTCLIGVASFILTFALSNCRRSKQLTFICGCSVLVELYFMIFISYNRGALLALLILFALFFTRRMKKISYRLFSFSCMAILGLYLAINLRNVLIFIYNLFSKYSISANFLSKSIYFLTLDDFSAGRADLYKSAINLFYKSPLFGNGIGYFASVNNGQYPHNVFLEALAEQGIIIAMILLIFCLVYIYRILTVRQNNFFTLSVLLFSLSIPRLMISSTIWMSPFFWALIIAELFNSTPAKTKV